MNGTIKTVEGFRGSMKKFIIYIGIFIICYSFVSTKNSNLVQSNKIQPNKNLFTTTLDSLQGTWVLDLDPKYKIIISGNKLYDTYHNVPNDTSNILFANDCIVTPISFYNRIRYYKRKEFLDNCKDGVFGASFLLKYH